MNPMLVAQLKALRMTLAAAVHQVDAMLAGDVVQGDAACPHPRNRREDASTMGGEARYICHDCGQVVEKGGV